VRALIVIALAAAILAVVVGLSAPVQQSHAGPDVAWPRPATGPLETGVFDPFMFKGAAKDIAFDRVHKAGAKTAELLLSWSDIAPGGDVKPAGFDASNPADPHYKWTRFDASVESAVAHGLDPVALILDPPAWAAGENAYGRVVEPSPTELQLFATAAAKRYSGTFLGLPRIRYWGAWNEPNLPFYLVVQAGNSLTGWYRNMVNAVAAGVHGVSASNLVVAGNLAPFTSKTGATDRWGMAPLAFMRSLLCLSDTLQPSCSATVHFDIWAHHPYTSGGPNHQALRPDDVSLGDLPDMRKVLVAGIKAGHVVSAGNIAFWVTEFSWDSNPPDPGGLKPGLLSRWTAEALYRCWRAGVTNVIWFLVTDQPMNAYFAQSGLYLRGTASPQSDKPKLLLQSFRFPFVAYQIGNPKAGSNRAAAYPKNGIRVLVWGRVPSAQRERVIVEQRRGSIWRPIASLTTNRYGIFGRKLYAPTKGSVRARAIDEKTVSHVFSLARPKDRFVSPFGQGWTD
jgi:hypothetical protein